MTKQEQRHQIIIALINKNFETKNVVKIANNIMAEMYGKDWESQPEVEYIPGCGCQHAETFHPLIAEQHDCPNFEREHTMGQLELTEKQKEILKRLNDVVQEALEAKIGFVYDLDDYSLNAYNASNQSERYAGRDSRTGYDFALLYGGNFSQMINTYGFVDYYDGSMESYFVKPK